MPTLISHKNCQVEIFVLVCACIVQWGQILSSGDIIIAFSSPTFVGTPKFMLVACLLVPENYLNFDIYRE